MSIVVKWNWKMNWRFELNLSEHEILRRCPSSFSLVCCFELNLQSGKWYLNTSVCDTCLTSLVRLIGTCGVCSTNRQDWELSTSTPLLIRSSWPREMELRNDIEGIELPPCNIDANWWEMYMCVAQTLQCKNDEKTTSVSSRCVCAWCWKALWRNKGLNMMWVVISNKGLIQSTITSSMNSDWKLRVQFRNMHCVTERESEQTKAKWFEVPTSIRWHDLRHWEGTKWMCETFPHKDYENSAPHIASRDGIDQAEMKFQCWKKCSLYRMAWSAPHQTLRSMLHYVKGTLRSLRDG